MRTGTDDLCRRSSVAIKWYVPEIYEQEATKLLQGNHVFHAPELIYPEFSNILWKKVRRGEITSAEGQRIIAAFAQKNLILHPHQPLIKSAYAGAESTGQTVYDWAYLALAISLSCEFATADEKFYQALEKPPHDIGITDFDMFDEACAFNCISSDLMVCLLLVRW